VDVLNWKPRATRLQGHAYVGGKLACEAVVTCQLVPRERKPPAEVESAPTPATVTQE
jgi:3-hydroxyacyl-[acyl-carrier-protein] dehydratase